MFDAAVSPEVSMMVAGHWSPAVVPSAIRFVAFVADVAPAVPAVESSMIVTVRMVPVLSNEHAASSVLPPATGTAAHVMSAMVPSLSWARILLPFAGAFIAVENVSLKTSPLSAVFTKPAFVVILASVMVGPADDRDVTARPLNEASLLPDASVTVLDASKAKVPLSPAENVLAGNVRVTLVLDVAAVPGQSDEVAATALAPVVVLENLNAVAASPLGQKTASLKVTLMFCGLTELSAADDAVGAVTSAVAVAVRV